LSDVTREDAGSINLNHYWNVIRQNKWWIIGISAVITILVAVFLSMMKPIYSATAVIQIETKQAETVPIRDVYGIETTTSYEVNLYRTQLQLLQSRQLLEQVIDRLGLEQRDEFQQAVQAKQWIKLVPEKQQGGAIAQLYEKLLEKMQATLDVEHWFEAETEQQLFSKAEVHEIIIAEIRANLHLRNISRTSLLEITYESSSPQTAAEICNALAQLYILENLAMRGDKTTTATSWMQERTVLLRERLDAAQNELQSYIEKEKLVNIGGAAGHTGVDVLASEELSSLTQRVAQARLLISELEADYGEKHPRLQAAREELRRANSTLQQRGAQIRSLGRKNVKLQELQHNVTSAQALYQTFFNRTNEAIEAATLELENAHITEPAVTPMLPIKPDKKKIIVVVLLGSLLLAAFVVLLLDMMNSTIRSVRDVENKLGQPMLGMLPMLKSRRRKHPNVASAMVEAVNACFSEAMSTIRTGLILSALDNPHKVLLLTSSAPGEGKTTTAISLAISMGKMEKVLLIDSDMRRPSINRWCSIGTDKPGLSEFVAGTAELRDCIIRQEQLGIDLLTAGQCPSNPLELISSDHFTTLLADLQQQYDRIIIDSPPVQSVSDALILSSYAKSVIYVVKANSTRTTVARAGIERLLKYGAPLSGVVLNQVDTKKISKYGDGEEYGGYFDHYGYGSRDDSRLK